MKVRIIYIIRIYRALFGNRFPIKGAIRCARFLAYFYIVIFNQGREDAKNGVNGLMSLYELYGNRYPNWPEVNAKIWHMCRESYLKGKEAKT